MSGHKPKNPYVVHVGRNANNGSKASVFALNANNASSNSNRNIGSQLAGGKSQGFGPRPERANKNAPITPSKEHEKRGVNRR